ncbi:TonB-dependent receptor [Rugamonas rubra]|uniref:Iron complex outermembrane recepter protein n=1 Tax=Rugamonas rubra TaxID=758825 RepID=A0A1I4LGH1_9BURK|nr:TonB-dependent receptor [Rugamonas rubra]SFL90114.1 iron complex outermembrane recepter protein [Rugamonas rubra]
MFIRSLPSFARGVSCRLLPCALALSSLFGLAAGGARAQQPGADADSALEIGRVEVRGKRVGALAARTVLSSVDILGADLVADQQVQNTWELFGRAPGVTLTQFRQGNESGKLSFRGFNGEGEVNAVKLLIDGVPSNDNGGGMPFLDMIFPQEIQGIEIVRGTNDPRYGLHNIAGNANVLTRTGGNYRQARLDVGSFATRQVQLSAGVEDGNWSQNYSFGRLESAGYRDHSRFDKYTLGGKWFYTSDARRWRVGLSVRHSESGGQEAGYLTAADAYRAPTLSYPYAQSEGGNRQMNQASVQLDGEPGETLSAAARLYTNSVKDQRWLRYAILASQQERVIDEAHHGLSGSLTWRPRGLAGVLRDMSLEGGINAERQNDASPRYATLNQVRTATTRDQRFTFDNYGAYVQAVFMPMAGLKLIPALRVDRFAGSLSDPSKNQHFAIQDYGWIRQPKFSVVYAPWRAASLYGNWGRTFQVGAGAAAYRSTAGELKPSINEGWEGGVKFTPADWLDGRLAVWRQDASDEVKRRLNDPSGGSENVGKTRRQGVDLQLNLRPSDDSTAWASYSWQRARIVEPDPAAPATLGKQIDHVPATLFSAGLDYRPGDKLRLRAWSNGQGGYYLTTANTGAKYGAYVLFNASARYQVRPELSLELQVKNLTDRYIEYVWINDQTRHAPGDGRALSLSAQLAF